MNAPNSITVLSWSKRIPLKNRPTGTPVFRKEENTERLCHVCLRERVIEERLRQLRYQLRG